MSFSISDRAPSFEDVEAFQIQDILDLAHIQEINKATEAIQTVLENIVEERIRELKQTLQKVEHLSNTDYLTGCFNRQYLQHNLEKEIKRSQRYGRRLSILLCDIDHFKRVNDLHGHQCGEIMCSSNSRPSSAPSNPRVPFPQSPATG